MRYLFSCTIQVGDKHEKIQADDVARWKRQMNTPYAEVSEGEKESDRELADAFIAALPPVARVPVVVADQDSGSDA
jgi:hypothetical protein